MNRIKIKQAQCLYIYVLSYSEGIVFKYSFTHYYCYPLHFCKLNGLII